MGKNQELKEELKKGCRIQGRKKKKKERKLVVNAVITRIKRHVWFIMEKGRPEQNMWNETGTFRSKFGWKIRNGPRFEMRWKLFHFVSFFELVWNVSTIPNETKWNWQPIDGMAPWSNIVNYVGVKFIKSKDWDWVGNRILQ